jgi:hypothetical protein
MHTAFTPDTGTAAPHSPTRALIVSGDQHILVESSPQFVNVRISLNGCEPVAIPADISDAVALAIVQAGRDVASHVAHEKGIA